MTPVGALEEAVFRLVARIEEEFPRPRLEGPGAADRKDLVRRSSENLLVGAIADQPRRFTRGFRRSVERQWPFSLGAIRRLRRRAERRVTGATSRLPARRGVTSLLDLVPAP